MSSPDERKGEADVAHRAAASAAPALPTVGSGAALPATAAATVAGASASSSLSSSSGSLSSERKVDSESDSFVPVSVCG